jgi:sterol desaturase/sphingolipid hydroxylase (fatty acid hydroxylase superfamily)
VHFNYLRAAFVTPRVALLVDRIDYFLAPLCVLALLVGLLPLTLFVLGYVAWTFFEYWLHRSVFHNPRFRSVWKAHMAHHHAPRDVQGLSSPVPVLTLSATGVGLAYPAFAPLIGGFIAGYVGYLLIHWALHAFEDELQGNPPRHLAWLQEKHARHHHGAPLKWFGLHTFFWDYVFGTAEPPYKGCAAA